MGALQDRMNVDSSRLRQHDASVKPALKGTMEIRGLCGPC